MKKLLTALLVALSVTAVSKAAMAADLIYNVNYGATSVVGDTNYNDAGVVGPDPSYWNYFGNGSISDPSQLLNVSAVPNGEIGMSSSGWSQSSFKDLQGYIIGGDSQGDIRTHVKATDPDWARATQGYIYVYTDTDFVMPGFEGYSGTTIDAGSLYSSTYADGSGNVYNVWRYGVTATTPGEVYIRTTGNDIIGSGTGRVNAMQFQAVPEPNSAMLLGIGGLIGAVMLRRKYAVEA